MKGGDSRYIVTSRDYGSGFAETVMDSSLVHLMLVEKCDNLPLRIGSRWMCIAFYIWGFRCLALYRGMAMEVTSCL